MTEYRLVNYHLASTNESGHMPSCDHCGHDIKHCFVIRDSSGATLTVGSECVNHFLHGEQQYTADVMKKRVTRAGRQWRDSQNGKKAPACQDGETREAYIERRVAEMSNAFTAFTAWSRWNKRQQGAYWYCKKVWSRFNRRWQSNIALSIEDGFYKPYHHQVNRIARRYNANPFDFTRSVWDVRKI